MSDHIDDQLEALENRIEEFLNENFPRLTAETDRVLKETLDDEGGSLATLSDPVLNNVAMFATTDILVRDAERLKEILDAASAMGAPVLAQHVADISNALFLVSQGYLRERTGRYVP